MKVKVVLTDDKSELKEKKYTTDYGVDIRAVSIEEIAPNVYKYGLGVKFQMDIDELNKYRQFGSKVLASIDFRPRSSVYKTGMILSNCIGTIDEQYTGEVSAIFYHVMPNMPKYEVGDFVGQICLSLTEEMEFEYVTELIETERGENGYGSTGIK